MERKKYHTTDPYGEKITSGGILFYDKTGIWLIEEKMPSGTFLTDFGGKFEPQDVEWSNDQSRTSWRVL